MKRLLEQLLTFIGFGPSPGSALGRDVDPYDSPEYQEYVAECAKYCQCSHVVCESVLAGAPCDMRIEEDDDWDEEPDFTLDDLEWAEQYPHL